MYINQCPEIHFNISITFFLVIILKHYEIINLIVKIVYPRRITVDIVDIRDYRCG